MELNLCQQRNHWTTSSTFISLRSKEDDDEIVDMLGMEDSGLSYGLRNSIASYLALTGENDSSSYVRKKKKSQSVIYRREVTSQPAFMFHEDWELEKMRGGGLISQERTGKFCVHNIIIIALLEIRPSYTSPEIHTSSETVWKLDFIREAVAERR